MLCYDLGTFFPPRQDTHSASFNAHVQVKTTISQLPPDDNMFKILSDVRGIEMVKNLQKKEREKEGKKGEEKGS